MTLGCCWCSSAVCSFFFFLDLFIVLWWCRRVTRHHVMLVHQWETSGPGRAGGPDLEGSSSLPAVTSEGFHLISSTSNSDALILMMLFTGVFTRSFSKLFRNPREHPRLPPQQQPCQGLQGLKFQDAPDNEICLNNQLRQGFLLPPATLNRSAGVGIRFVSLSPPASGKQKNQPLNYGCRFMISLLNTETQTTPSVLVLFPGICYISHFSAFLV